MNNLISEIRQTLADVTSFYFKAHSAHWNVVGPNFSEYHSLFGDIYEDVYGSIDTIAEFLRKLGTTAPFGLNEIIAGTQIGTTKVGQDAASLAKDLLSANDTVLNVLNSLFNCATANSQQAIANFIAERLDMHQKWKWQLSASLGMEANQNSSFNKNVLGLMRGNK